MSKPTKTSIEDMMRGADWSADFMNKLLVAVKEIGGDAEVFHDLVRPTGRMRLACVADAIVGWTARKIRLSTTDVPGQMLFESCNFSRPRDKIGRTDFDRIRALVINEPIPSSHLFDVTLVKYNHAVHLFAIQRQAEARGYRWATPRELCLLFQYIHGLGDERADQGIWLDDIIATVDPDLFGDFIVNADPPNRSSFSLFKHGAAAAEQEWYFALVHPKEIYPVSS